MLSEYDELELELFGNNIESTNRKKDYQMFLQVLVNEFHSPEILQFNDKLVEKLQMMIETQVN
jgi:hypothetical protein